MRGEYIFVFCYDISRDRSRRRAAELLERSGTRVQESVFEVRATAGAARALLGELGRFRAPGDSVRMYCLTDVGRRHSASDGGAPIAEEAEFWLL